MKRYHWQCTDRQDYVEIVGKFFKRCRNRGWELKHLKRIFLEAEHKLSNPKPLPTSIDDPQDLVEQLDNDPNTRDRLFLKVPFHPNYIPRHRIREIYRQECEDELRQHVGIERFTVAYSRPPNVGDIITLPLGSLPIKILSYGMSERQCKYRCTSSEIGPRLGR